MKKVQLHDAYVKVGDADYIPRSFYRPHKRVTAPNQIMNPKTGEFVTPERRVKQSHVAECDINNILKQYQRTGQIAHVNARAQQGAYLDLPDDMDFQNAMNIVKEGEVAFATLTSKLRERFGNDPAQFLAFMADPENYQEAQKLGLLKTPVPVPVAPPTGTTGGDGGTPPSEGPRGPVASEKAP